MIPKTIALIGATGSVGRQTMEVVQSLFPQFEFSLLSSHQDYTSLKEISAPWTNAQLALTCEQKIDLPGHVIQGTSSIIEAIQLSPPDVLFIASSGVTAYPVLRDCYSICPHIAVANKEILIMAGCSGLLEEIKKTSCLMPVDSEHASIHQLLDGKNLAELKQIYLTASGGPFYSTFPPKNDLNKVTIEEALNHPTWKMGKKISLDSATMANKGIEILEAHYLFNLSPQKIKVLIHPLSLIHAIAEWADHTSTLHMAPADMKICIQYALTWPNRLPSSLFKKTDWNQISNLPFVVFDASSIESIHAAYEALDERDKKPYLPLVYIAADEYAIELFLNHKISFIDIGRMILDIIHQAKTNDFLDNLPLNPYNVMDAYREIADWMKKGIKV